MAGANSNIQVSDLDFANIKANFIRFLQGQDTFKDYNFSGSALSTLLDVLSYNTQYNAYYLNMVANEMFLDSALQRGSVVSHAKLLGYTPKSSLAPTALINMTVSGSSDASLTLPRFTQFISEPVSGIPYVFVTTDAKTVPVYAGVATFSNVLIKQGIPVTLTFSYSQSGNPYSTFQLPDPTIDTSSILVEVYPNPNGSSFDTFTLATDYLMLDGKSKVYFLEESVSGYYQMNFGNGIIGQQLVDGSKIVVSYLTTSGAAAVGANNFVISSPIGNYNTLVFPIAPSSGGQNRESIDSIKYQAPKNYSAQGRAVTKEDYITLIQQNNLGFSFDAVNVWGGQENNPPAYGQVFVCLKPTGAYTLTNAQKQEILSQVINPISVMTVSPTIVDPDYTYLQLTTNVLYDQKKTNYTTAQIQNIVKNSVSNFAKSTLNTFNSTFSISELSATVQASDPSIITNETSVVLQKKFLPKLSSTSTYKLYYNAPLKRGILSSGVSSFPAMKFLSLTNSTTIIDGVYIEEEPTSVGGVESISLINPGFSYQYTPTVMIDGDGSGATAVATINPNGQLSSITVTNTGNNYTQAVVSIVPAANDTTGKNGAAYATLQGQYGNLRTYYYNSNGVKTVFNSSVGTIDYVNGIITLTNFAPYDVDNDTGQLTISAAPTTTIISSSYNRIITVDPYDPSSITINATAK